VRVSTERVTFSTSMPFFGQDVEEIRGRSGEGGYAARAGRATGPPAVVMRGMTGIPSFGPIVGI
jgi:hypothetical protein